MSITDAKDHDKSTKRSSSSEGDRAADHGDGDGDGGGKAKRPPLEPYTQSHGGTLLTAEQRREVSYRRTAELLRSEVPVRRAGGDGDGDGEGPEITVTPSLVSLSVDFFSSAGPGGDAPSGAGEGSAGDGTESAPSASAASKARGGSGAATASAALSATGPDDGTASAPSAAASSASPGRRRTYGTASDPTYAFPSLRPRLGHDGPDGRPPSLRDALGPASAPHPSWPVGPQGAPVPEHLAGARRREDVDDEGGVGSLGGPTADPADPPAGQDSMALLRDLAELRRRQQLQSDAVGQFGRRGGPSGLGAPSSSAVGGGRDRNRVYINAVRSLEHSLSRLERRLDSTGGAAGRGSASRSSRVQGLRSPSRALPGDTPGCDVDSLELETVSGLLEIMLHPPLSVRGGRYGFGDGDGGRGDLGDEMDAVTCDDGGDGGCASEASGGARGAAPRTRDGAPGDEANYSQDSDVNPAASKDDDDVDMEAEDDGAELLMGEHDRPPKHPPGPPSLPSRPSRYATLPSIIAKIESLGDAIPRRVCQYPFRRNDIVWVCRTCQADETCVLCHECFSGSDHDGHDVAFYHAQAGGCCDCGDPDAWDAKGFCSKHGGHRTGLPSADDAGTCPPAPPRMECEPSVLGSVKAVSDWLVTVVQSSVENGYRRANPQLFPGEDRATSTDSSLPEHYEEKDGGRDRRRDGDRRRGFSLGSQNSTADVGSGSNGDESASAAAPSASFSPDDQAGSPMHDLDESSATRSPMLKNTARLHEAQFEPSMAGMSRSSRRIERQDSLTTSFKRGINMTENHNDVFDPDAAGTSSKSRASKKARSSDVVQSPAMALGDLGRRERGLFLVLHSDDIHMGGHHMSRREDESIRAVLVALKELYSSPGNGSGGGASSLAGGGGISGRGDFAPVHADTGFQRADALLRAPVGGNRRAPPPFPGVRTMNILGGISRYNPFRAPNAEAILKKIVKLIKKQGDLIVWGTQEILAECGDVAGRCWRDGDPHSSTLVGAAMLNRAKILTDRGLVVSIKTYNELRNEQKATAALNLIDMVAHSCDPLCDQVSAGLSVEGALTPMLRNDLKLPCQFVHSWHSVLLTLLAVPEFKAAMANSYCDTYRSVTSEYARGVGIIERSSYTLSVQFLNRVSYVTELVRDRHLLTNLSRCMLEIIRSASFIPGTPGSPSPAGSSPDMIADLESSSTPEASMTAALLALLGYFPIEGKEDDSLNLLDQEINQIFALGRDSRHHGRSSIERRSKVMDQGSAAGQSLLARTAALVPPTLDPNHIVLAHRRYSVCISDLKCVLNVEGMSRCFASLPVVLDSGSSSDDVKVEDTLGTESNYHCALDDWLKMLSLAQAMDGQMWRPWVKGHVETEPKGWVPAFNATISLSSLFERLLQWNDNDPSPVHSDDMRLLSCAELTHYCLTTGIHRWQRTEMLSYRPTMPPSTDPNPSISSYALAPASLPLSTVAARYGSALAMCALPLPQIAVWSFHLPLHRFVAACIRECSRRQSHSGGIASLLEMFSVQSSASGKKAKSQFRLNTLLFRGLMEFPTIVMARVAQIRTGIWRRNGPGMSDQVLNYAEPPFCRSMADSDLLILQFALICHAFEPAGEGSLTSGLNFAGAGTMRFVNLLLHRLGLFDFVGLKKAPNADVERYKQEIERGMYPGELPGPDEEQKESESCPTPRLVLPWTYSPVHDPPALLKLVDEFLHIIILLVTEMLPPSPQSRDEELALAQRKLRREVVHRLASGAKTHSEMAEVHHVLTQRDNCILTESISALNGSAPDDASGASLELILDQVGSRKVRQGAPDLWQLNREAWREYDPAFFHISIRNHQQASELRPKSKKDDDALPFAPEPSPAHVDFKRIRRDLTADSVVLAVCYCVLHSHCTKATFAGGSSGGSSMYQNNIKNEVVLSRAVHLLTIGAYSWSEPSSDVSNWRGAGGDGVGSVFHDKESAPSISDWVEMALLSDPENIMASESYKGQENALLLLNRIACGERNTTFLGGLDPSLVSGAKWLCQFAVKHNTRAAEVIGPVSVDRAGDANSAESKETDLEKRKKAAKERAMAMMKAQMAKFAANIGVEIDSDEEMEDAAANEGAAVPPSAMRIDTTETNDVSTPLRTRSQDGEDLHALDLSPTGDFLLTTPLTPRTPKTPQSAQSCSTKAKAACTRLFSERPRCIICGNDHESEPTDLNTVSGTPGGQDKALSFCGFSQASLVLKGCEPVTRGSDPSQVNRLVGVHVTICGHAIHKSCWDTYIKTQRDDRVLDRVEGGSKRREFRCPLCQRLSNSLVPFIDVGKDWLDRPTCHIVATDGKPERSDDMHIQNEVDEMQIQNDVACAGDTTLSHFLSTTKWWASRNDTSVVWDGHCTFSQRESFAKTSKLAAMSVSDQPLTSPPRKRQASLRKIGKIGKRELVHSWNAVFKTRRQGKKSARRTAPTNIDVHTLACSSSMSQDASQDALPHPSKTYDGPTDVLRRFMDAVCDVVSTYPVVRTSRYFSQNSCKQTNQAYKADLKRLGEEGLVQDFGEFRHHMTEKAAFNKANRAAGKEMVEWPMCISLSTMTDAQRQEMSREKLTAKLLSSVQSFTYTVCSEAAEARRLLRKAKLSTGRQAVLSKFGISDASLCNEFLLLPEPDKSIDDGFQPFDGRIGKLRYLALSLMLASSPLSKELVQLSMDFPETRDDPFDFDQHERDLIQRAHVAYPILNSHILTHITSGLVAVTGRARAEEGEHSIDSVVTDCRNFVQLGLIARVSQVLLSELAGFIDDSLLMETTKQMFGSDSLWSSFCATLIEILMIEIQMSNHGKTTSPQKSTEDPSLSVIHAIQKCEVEAMLFLSDIAVICQILTPNFFSGGVALDQQGRRLTLEDYLAAFQIDVSSLFNSSLSRQLVRSWQSKAMKQETNQLEFARHYHAKTWPVAALPQPDLPPGCLPLFGSSGVDIDMSLPHLRYLPKSYTDLYSKVSRMNDTDQTAVCLVTGRVLNAAGEGLCHKHAVRLCGGAGIFFLVQECQSLIIHGSKAAYVHSPYVDFYGETPHYRGRPLNLDADRLEILHGLWSGHLIRERVAAERASTRQVIIEGYY